MASFGIKIFGWIEILTFIITIVTLMHIDYYPMIMLFLPIPVVILGIFTLRLSPLARRLNLSLSPLVVLTYSFGFMMVFEYIMSVVNSSFKINQFHFGILFIITLIIHIFFFTRPSVKKQFTKPQVSSK